MPQVISATSRRTIKQLGMQRSGTNYLEKLLRLNFRPKDVLVLNNQLGCKHHAISEKSIRTWVKEKGKLQFLLDGLDSMYYSVNVRNPMSWSLGFLQHRKRLGDKVNLKDPKVHIEQIQAVMPVLRNWRDLLAKNQGRAWIIRFEDLVADYLPVMKEISEYLGLQPRGGEFHNINQEVLSGGRVAKSKYKRRGYHVSGKWKSELTPKVQQAIMDTMDWELAAFFGYLPDYD